MRGEEEEEEEGEKKGVGWGGANRPARPYRQSGVACLFFLVGIEAVLVDGFD